MSYEDTTHISSVDPTYELQPQTFEELRSWLEQYCRGEKNHGEPNTWDVTLVTDMSNLFTDMPLFNAPIDQWDTSKVTDMRFMFNNTTTFNQPLTFNTSQVTNMGSMFQDATSFNQPLPFDTEQVTTMEWMFRGAIAFNQPLSWGAVACPAGKLRVSDGADCTVPVE